MPPRVKRKYSLKSGSSQAGTRPRRVRKPPKQRQLADFTAEEMRLAIIRIMTRVSRIASGLDEATQRKALEFKFMLQDDVEFEKVPTHRKIQEKKLRAPVKAPFVGTFDVVKDELCKVITERNRANEIPATVLQPSEEKGNSDRNLIGVTPVESAPGAFSDRWVHEDTSTADTSCNGNASNGTNSLAEKIAKFKRGEWGEVPVIVGAMPPSEDEGEWGKIVETSDTKSQAASQAWLSLPYQSSAPYTFARNPELAQDITLAPRKRILEETQLSAVKQQPLGKQQRTANHQSTARHGEHHHSSENGHLSAVINASREMREKKRRDRGRTSPMEGVSQSHWFNEQNAKPRQGLPEAQDLGNRKTYLGGLYQPRKIGEDCSAAPFDSSTPLETYAVDDLLAALDTEDI